MDSRYLSELFADRELPFTYQAVEKQNAFERAEFQQLELLLNSCHQKAKINKSVKPQIYSSQVIDNLLVDLFSGDYSKKQARYFLNHAYNSAAFTEKVLRNLRITAYPVTITQNEKYIPSTNELMASLKSRLGEEQKTSPWKLRLPRLSPHYLFVMGAIILAIGFINKPTPKAKMYQKHLGQPVLIDIDSSNLRGNGGTEASSIETNLLWGISHYQAEEYSQAAHTFKLIIKNNATELEQQPKLAKNIYIYQGLSYLALSKGIEHSPFLDQAITALEHAMQFDGDADDDLIFYCGLGHFFKGNSEKAVTYLHRITQESHYFADAKYLIKKMQ